MADLKIPRKPRTRRPLAQRLWEKVIVGEGCWLFTGFLDKWGYGQIGIGGRGKPMFAHRASYLLTVGPIPSGLNVLHSCDRPACVRPDHLFLGTHGNNVADKVRKGRQRKGEMVHNAKLNSREVAEIRRLCQEGMGARTLAQLYGVTMVTIREIKRGVTWRHLLNVP